MSQQEAKEQYLLSLKKGQKYYKNAIVQGIYPYPQVLDEILDESMSAGQAELGLVDIPAERIIGTRTEGRRAAFAGNFMPLLEDNTEFAAKWISLCAAHLGDEGIREPIKCYEYLGRFYVAEGNKRVSVMKSYDAPTIPGYVTRILPVYSDDPSVQRYYEFLRFYPRCNLYQIQFTMPGAYEKLQSAMGFDPEHVWTLDEKRAYLALLTRFRAAYEKLGGAALAGTVSDALLVCLQVFSFAELKAQSSDELRKTLEAMWADVKSASLPQPIAVSTAPEEKEKGILSKILGLAHPDHLHVAFIYAYDPQESAWTRAHLHGQHDLERALGDKLTVKEYWALDHHYDKAMADAVADGAELLFATTPQMISACRKIAALHPELRVMNCALSQPYTGLRTYYCRTYEAKFITGAIAGAMAETDRIGYISNYPIVGVPANINAFALGAQMTNPRAKVELIWSSETVDPLLELIERGVTVISNRDATNPKHAHWALEWGTYKLSPEGRMQPLALPCWDWGRFYEQVVRSVFNGSWEALGKSQSDQAINYWWGMGSGVIDVQLSLSLPAGIRRLAEHLCHDIRGGWIDPFQCKITDQAGTIRNDGTRALTPEEIMKMNWLCDNVIGHIPSLEELRPEAVDTARILAIERQPEDNAKEERSHEAAADIR